METVPSIEKSGVSFSFSWEKPAETMIHDARAFSRNGYLTSTQAFPQAPTMRRMLRTSPPGSYFAPPQEESFPVSLWYRPLRLRQRERSFHHARDRKPGCSGGEASIRHSSKSHLPRVRNASASPARANHSRHLPRRRPHSSSLNCGRGCPGFSSRTRR